MSSDQKSTASAANFLSLPTEIRTDIYKQLFRLETAILVFQMTDSLVQSFIDRKPPQLLALLYTNKQLCVEATTVLYSSNKFTIVGNNPTEQVATLQTFFNSIGPRNASSLSHVCIYFPHIESPENQGQDRFLTEDSLRILRLLRESCVNLKTLEMFIHHHKVIGLGATDPANHVPDALLHIDAQVKTIGVLNKIIVRVYDRAAPASVQSLMHALGWMVLKGDEGEREV